MPGSADAVLCGGLFLPDAYPGKVDNLQPFLGGGSGFPHEENTWKEVNCDDVNGELRVSV